MREEMHAVVQEISERREARRAVLTGLKKQVARLARDRDTLREVTGQSLREARQFLQKLSDRRQREARRLRKDLARGNDGLARAGGERRRATRAWTSTVTSNRLAASRRRREDRTSGRTELRTELAAWLDGIRSDRAAARREWDGLTSGPGRQAVRTAESQRLATATTHRAGREATAPAAPAGDESLTLRDRIFARLADYPDGVPLVQIEREFGLRRLAASRLVRSLIEDGKAQKRERRYFAT